MASLCAAAEVTFANPQARLLEDLLCYITHENDKSIMHALVCTLHIILKQSHAPQEASAAVQLDACVQDKSRPAQALLDVLSQVAAAAAAASVLILYHALAHKFHTAATV
jgi:hypothetical protein